MFLGLFCSGNLNESRCNFAPGRKRGLEMKKVLVVSMAIMFAGVAAIAQAANVTFNPGSVEVTCEPGTKAVAKLMANAESTEGFTMYLQVDSVLDEGIIVGPAAISLAAGAGGGVATSPMDLEVDVPVGTPGGTYRAVITPTVMMSNSTEPDVINNVTIDVNVPGEMKKCNDKPAFKDVKVGPKNVRAPRNGVVKIKLSGSVVADPDCKATGKYSMESSGDPVTGDLDINADGSFEQRIAVKVSKKKYSRNGKTYNGTLSLVDEEGQEASQGFFVKVGHDRGKKKGHYKEWKKSWKSRWNKYWRRDK